MNLRTKLIWGLYGICAICSSPKGTNAQNLPTNEKPNIVLIFVDDMGYGDLECYGATQYETPNLDHLAAGGVRFTHFYAVQSICTASRAGMLSGCYPNRLGISGAFFPGSDIGLNPEEEIVPELLKKQGYKSIAIGKWHLGDDQKFLPLQQGFDEYFGLPYSNDMWPVNYDGTPVTPENHRRPGSYPPLPLISGNERIRVIRNLQDMSQLTTLYTEEAVKFIQANKKQPFFLYLAHNMPHVPLAVSDKFNGKSKQGLYGDVVMELDWSVGQILEALDENGLTKNTLVIFTSDNGPWANYGNHAGSTGGLREGKGTSFEGGQREPCIMKWPNVIPAGTVCSELACTIDILPTLSEITGSPLPKKKIDGVNILSLMKGDPDANPRKYLYYYYHENSLEAVRNDGWKLVFPHRHRSYEGKLPGKDGYPGETVQREIGLALYDLRRDPGERYDVKALYPDIVQELENVAKQAREDLGDDLTGDPGKNRRLPGHL